MLKRLYVDNFKCLSNFDLTLGPLTLLMGRNGSGKTTVFEALRFVRQFARGRHDLTGEGAGVTAKSLTRWDTRPMQTLALDVVLPDGEFGYRLEIEHDRDRRRARVSLERLTHDAKTIFEFVSGEVHLYRDDYTAGPAFPADWSRSGLAGVPGGRGDNRRLTAFKGWLEKLWILTPDPRRMKSESIAEAEEPGDNLEHLASWYRYVLQGSTLAAGKLLKDLSDVIPGFQELQLLPAGDAKLLKVRLACDGSDGSTKPTTHTYDFSELSDGQRALIGLHALLRLAIAPTATLLLDEPDNYLALVEIQPWLAALRDAIDDEAGSQVLLISHHPEVLNFFAPSYGQLLERENGGAVRVRPWDSHLESSLTPAETLARGWE